MKISNTVETKEGTVVFVGELDGVQLDMVIQLGLLSLMSAGALTMGEIPPKGEQH